MWNLPGKIGRAVDRIDYPDLLTDNDPASLFPQKTVLRKSFGKPCLDMAFNRRIRFGQKILRSLHGNLGFRALHKAIARDSARRTHQVQTECLARIEIDRHAGASHNHVHFTSTPGRSSLARCRRAETPSAIRCKVG